MEPETHYVHCSRSSWVDNSDWVIVYTYNSYHKDGWNYQLVVTVFLRRLITSF
jgi:hypothetical protein